MAMLNGYWPANQHPNGGSQAKHQLRPAGGKARGFLLIR